MTTARKQQVHLDVTRWYHCTTRCVRRAFICGFDSLTKRDYSHRRQWIEERLLLLTRTFCIDVGAYAILDNHYHVLLHIDLDRALALSDKHVVERWLTIYSGNDLAQRFNKGLTLSEAETDSLSLYIKQWREELANISRFMAEVNQNIARRANLEDGCKGRFWEARFKSQGVLDVDAVLRTMVYVDLNPVRAKIATTPEQSRHTSIFRRLNNDDTDLIPFAPDGYRAGAALSLHDTAPFIPITFEDYQSLLDWTSRHLTDSNKGHVPENAPPIFARLNYSQGQWMNTLNPPTSWTQKALGSSQRIKEFCQAVGQKWIWQAQGHKVTNS